MPRIARGFAMEGLPVATPQMIRQHRDTIRIESVLGVEMAEWQFCIDESYNSHVFCVGGFLASKGVWKETADQWSARIQYENEKSAIAGLPPITRYHATDCAGLKREFSSANGWDIPRQIKLTKRICEIIGSEGPWGIVVGGRVSDMKKYLGTLPDCPKTSLFDLCFRMSLMLIVAAVREEAPGTQVRVIIDQGKNFGSVARSGFESLKQDQTVEYLKHCFTDLVAEDSRRFVALQAADFMACEAMRQLEAIRSGKNDIRKSLQALVGTQIPLHIAQFNDGNFADFLRMNENRNNRKPIGEGVESVMDLPVSSGHRLSLLP